MSENEIRYDLGGPDVSHTLYIYIVPVPLGFLPAMDCFTNADTKTS